MADLPQNRRFDARDGEPDLLAGLAGRPVEEALLESERRFRHSFESAAIGMALVGTDGRFLEVNDSLCELVGYPREELLRRTFQDITHPDDLESDLELTHRVLAGELRSYHLEKRYLRRDGRRVWALLSVSLVTAADGSPLHFVSQIQDVTQRKEAEERLAEAELRYRTLVEQLPIGMYIRPIDTSRPNIYASPQVEPMLGYPASDWERDPGMLERILHPDDRERILAAVDEVRATGAARRDEYRLLAPDGRAVWVEDVTRIVEDADGTRTVQGFLFDVTARKEAEAERDRLRDELHHAQKLESLGRLAGGIAHDFNNMLTAIRGYGELLVARLEPGTPAHHEATQITKAAEQAASLPPQLLAFGRKQPLQPVPHDVNEIIRSTGQLLGHLLGDEIALETRTDARPGRVLIDRSQFEHVLVNLALNAREAMIGGGSLSISTSDAELDAAAAEEHRVAPGAYVVVKVADSGHGMDEDTRLRAFDPYFTTKPFGKGSGLGLASVYGTVTQSGGFVTIESEPGTGTTFLIHLPAAAEPSAESGAGRGGRGVVLIAEDEDVVRSLAVEVLENAGFRVHPAADGAAALEAYEQLRGRVDVVVTDVVMPSLGGRELAAALLERDPGLPVVFMSGYTNGVLEEAPGAEGHSTFLAKPFSTAELVDAVDAALATRARATVPPLTPREREILTLIAAGQTNERVAAALGISPETVQSHVRHAARKLGAETRTEAVAIALRLALIA